MPQTTAQVLRCLTLGRYTAHVEDDKLKVRGPQPLAGPLPASIRANRDELVVFLGEWAGGTWPPASGSALRELEERFGCTLTAALDFLEQARRRSAA